MKNRETVAKVNLLSSKTNNKNTQPIILIFNAAVLRRKRTCLLALWMSKTPSHPACVSAVLTIE